MTRQLKVLQQHQSKTVIKAFDPMCAKTKKILKTIRILKILFFSESTKNSVPPRWNRPREKQGH